jgi:excisionase family DNA binding protein
MTAPIDTPWLTLAEVCEYGRIGRKEVLAALKSDELIGHQTKEGGRWRVHRDDVDSWLRGTPMRVRTAPITGRKSA